MCFFFAIKGTHSFIDVIYRFEYSYLKNKPPVSVKAFHIHNCDLCLFLYQVTALVLCLYFIDVDPHLTGMNGRDFGCFQ